MFNKLIQYFDIGLYDRPILGKPKKKKNFKKIVWTIIYYLCVVMGVSANTIMKQVEKNVAITVDFKSLLISLILSAVIFPFVYKTAKFNSSAVNPIQLFIAFQHGFFFETIFKTIIIWFC